MSAYISMKKYAKYVVLVSLVVIALSLVVPVLSAVLFIFTKVFFFFFVFFHFHFHSALNDTDFSCLCRPVLLSLIVVISCGMPTNY